MFHLQFMVFSVKSFSHSQYWNANFTQLSNTKIILTM